LVAGDGGARHGEHARAGVVDTATVRPGGVVGNRAVVDRRWATEIEAAARRAAGIAGDGGVLDHDALGRADRGVNSASLQALVRIVRDEAARDRRVHVGVDAAAVVAGVALDGHSIELEVAGRIDAAARRGGSRTGAVAAGDRQVFEQGR